MATTRSGDGRWQKSSLSGNTSCVEVAICEDAVLVRDSKVPHEGVLRFTHDEWRAFVAGAQAGEFDL